MTEIKFFFNVENKLAYACKWCRKAFAEGHKLVVYSSSPQTADEFDRMLWSASQLSFVPHVRANSPLAGDTPIIIATDDPGQQYHSALLNLDDEPPPFFSRFEQLREIVSTDKDDRLKARERQKFYTARGFSVVNQEIKANG